MGMTRFKTLLLREWMQHHRGWLAVVLIPPLLVLLMLISPWGHVSVDEQVPATLFAAAAMAISAGAVAGLSWFVSMLQLPGLARRDSQDRSIEFWLSLPASHSESIGAIVLTHALLAPLAALCVGALLAPLMAGVAVVKWAGFGALTEVAWLPLLAGGLSVVARVAVGVVLMTLWLAPLLLLPMAASAWLKRLGVPVTLALLLIGGLVLDKGYGNPVVWQLLKIQLAGANESLFSTGGGAALVERLTQEHDGLAATLTHWAGQDMLQALAALASPHLLGGLLIAAASFALLVLRRQRAH